MEVVRLSPLVSPYPPNTSRGLCSQIYSPSLIQVEDLAGIQLVMKKTMFATVNFDVKCISRYQQKIQSTNNPLCSYRNAAPAL